MLLSSESSIRYQVPSNNHQATTKATPSTSIMDQKEIVAEFNKKGYFDTRRKELFDLFVADETRQQQLEVLLKQLIKCKIEKDPDFFGKNRGKMSALIQTELVKRHVVKEKSKVKSGNRAHFTNNNDLSQPTAVVDGEYSETELLDRINDLLNTFSTSIEENEQFQNDVKAQLKG